MLKFIIPALSICCLMVSSCSTEHKHNATTNDSSFVKFESRLLDAYWKQHPSGAIFQGYGKYYEELEVPDSADVQSTITFCNTWLDSLKTFSFDNLDDNQKISYNILQHQLQSDKWYLDTFKNQQWDPSVYNLSGDCYYIIHQPYAPLTERLKILSQHIMHADKFYAAGLSMIHQPTKVHTQLAIDQNKGGLDVFGQELTDSINASSLSTQEKETLQQRVALTTQSINMFIDSLQKMLNNPGTSFRNFAIGKDAFDKKFDYDIVADVTPEAMYDKAKAEKVHYIEHMYTMAASVWQKYMGNTAMPIDSIETIRKVIDKISLKHATPVTVLDTLKNQVNEIKRFVKEKDLFNYDTAAPLVVRIMPAYAAGVSLANAEFPPPYQKEASSYFNIADISRMKPAEAESVLQEENDYAITLLTIHEAIPGHCMQGYYNSKYSPDIVRSVFQNGAMIEGWAVYTETMMMENGWRNDAPEMWLMHDKMKLRELANVIVDYDVQCLKYPKDSIMHLLVHDCFQTNAQAEEKYHRATVSQVQLCSYHTGSEEIFKLRDDYKIKMGSHYNLKDFHEKFLSYGCSPVKYIRERMMNN